MIELSVKDMTCNHCVGALHKALEEAGYPASLVAG